MSPEAGRPCANPRQDFQTFLTEASRLLAVNLDYRDTLSRVASLMLPRLADWCIVETADAQGSFTQVAVAHRDPAKAELAREMRRRYPPGADSADISLRVLRTRKSELIPDVSDILLRTVAEDAEHLSILRQLDPKSLIVVPLRTRERAIGAMLLANSESGRRFDLDDLEFAEDLATRAALAIDNATLYESEQEARRDAEKAAEWIGRLQAFTAALSGAVTPTAVAEVLIEEGAAAAGAESGFVRLVTPEGDQLRLVAAAGISSRLRRCDEYLPLMSPVLSAVVARSGAERYFGSAAAFWAASPEFADHHEAMGREAIAFLPLKVRRRPIGVMALGFADVRTFDRRDREILAELSAHGAQALERARLYEAERSARTTAEQAVKNTTRLQSLAAELAEALTPAQVAEVVVTQGIASIDADAGALQLLTDDGTKLEVIHGQGSDSTLFDGPWRELSTDLSVPSTTAVRTLEPVFIESRAEIDEHRAHMDDYPRAPAAPRVLGARAGAHVPLVLSGQALGVLYLGFTAPRQFSESQRSFVLALGRQCAQAMKRAQLYEAEAEGHGGLSRLVERLHEGVISVDRRGGVEFASSRAKQMLSAVPLEEGGLVPEVWLGFRLRSFALRLFDAEAGVVEIQVVSQDDERVFEVTGIPADRSDAALVVVTDVSERERRLRVEREFVDNAAHELRTPLAAITSSIARLQAGASEVPEKRERFLDHIQNESTRLNGLASSLLLLARAQSRREEPRRETLAVHGLLEEVAGELELRLGVELVLDCPAELLAYSNHDLLEHALLNLATNAVRHTTSGRIRVSARAGDDGSIIVEVEDTGSGIPAAEISRLFDRFYRGQNEKGRAGFGLGLPIAKGAVQALGGRVEIDSTPGEGTTARIVLPRNNVRALG